MQFLLKPTGCGGGGLDIQGTGAETRRRPMWVGGGNAFRRCEQQSRTAGTAPLNTSAAADTHSIGDTLSRVERKSMAGIAGLDCDQCGKSMYGGDVIAPYELTRSFVSMTPNRKDVDGPAGETLNVRFCSARCLCLYVEGHIAPDAATE